MWIMTLRSSDLQSDRDLNSIRNSWIIFVFIHQALSVDKGSVQKKGKFEMKGAGVSPAITIFWKMIFFENHLEPFPDCQNALCT